MTKPCHHLCDAAHPVPGRHLWAVDQDDGQAQLPRGNQLCLCPRPARVLGDDMADAMCAHQGKVAVNGEGASVDHHRGLRQRQGGFGRIDKAQQIVVPGFGGKGRKRLLADGQKDPRATVRHGGNGGFGIRHKRPSVACLRGPCGPHHDQQRNTGGGAGGGCIAAHLRGKGMGGIDNMAYPVRGQVRHQPRNAAKTTNPHGQGLRLWHPGAPGIGKHRVKPGPGYGGGQLACLGGATKDQDARHG